MKKRGVFSLTLSQWGHCDFTLNGGQYADNSPTLVINHPEDGPIAMMSVFVPGSNLLEDEVLIKAWSENAQIFEELVEKKVLIPVREVPTGFVEAIVCTIGPGANLKEY